MQTMKIMKVGEIMRKACKNGSHLILKIFKEHLMDADLK